jgi:hypothetical protein
VMDSDGRDDQDGCMEARRSSARTQPPPGGGPPILCASGVSVPKSTTDLSTAPLVLKLTVGSDAEHAGRKVVEIVKAACAAATDDEAVERVATVELFFHEVTRRVPEFHGFMNELVEEGRDDDVAAILAEPGRRERKREIPSVIALIELVMKEKAFVRAAPAIEWIDENLRGKTFLGMPGAGRLRNVYSQFRELFALWSGSLFVPPDLLAAFAWRSPREVERLRQQLPGMRATQLRGAVVLHAPEDDVYHGGNFSFESVRPYFSPGENRVVIVAASDPEMGPYSRYVYARLPQPGQPAPDGWRWLTETEIQHL